MAKTEMGVESVGPDSTCVRAPSDSRRFATAAANLRSPPSGVNSSRYSGACACRSRRPLSPQSWEDIKCGTARDHAAQDDWFDNDIYQRHLVGPVGAAKLLDGLVSAPGQLQRQVHAPPLIEGTAVGMQTDAR